MQTDDGIADPGQPSKIGISPDSNMDVSAILSITGDAELAEKFDIWEKEFNNMKKSKRWSSRVGKIPNICKPLEQEKGRYCTKCN